MKTVKFTLAICLLLMICLIVTTNSQSAPPGRGGPFQDILNQLDSIQTQLNGIQSQLSNPPSAPWSQKFPTAERFVVLADFNNEAVLDRETELVWEKAPYCSGTPNFCTDFDFY